MSAQHVAFLRAVNVGKRRVAMARLREAFVDLGHRDVSTYINSGNVVFTPPADVADSRAIETRIEAHLEELFGFEIPTHIRTADELRAVIAVARADGGPPPGNSHHIVFLREAPSPEGAAAIEALSGEIEDLRMRGREVHWRIHGGVSDSALTTRQWAKVGQADSTARNTTMLVKLLDRLG